MQLIVSIAQFSGPNRPTGSGRLRAWDAFLRGLGILVGRLQLTSFLFQNIGKGHLFDQRVAQRGIWREGFEQLRGDQCRRGSSATATTYARSA